jgi:hypothetical protein
VSAVDRLFKKAQEARRESKFVDFKSKLDFAAPGDWCEIIKDVVAMANSGGGVIVVGADNSGKPTESDCSSVLAVDAAKITDQIHRYTEVHFSDFEVRELKKGKSVLAAIIVGPAPIPMVFHKPGQYPNPSDPKKQITAFGQGTVYFRHGAKSETGTTEDIRQAIDRRLGEIRKEWIGGVRKVVAAPTGSQVTVLPPEVFTTTSAAATPIRVTDDPKAPAYRVVNVDDTYPFRLKELAAELKKRLPAGTVFGSFDVQVIRRLHGTDDNKAFFHSPRYGSPQYSPAFADWIVEQHKKDQQYFAKNRDALAKKMNT